MSGFAIAAAIALAGWFIGCGLNAAADALKDVAKAMRELE